MNAVLQQFLWIPSVAYLLKKLRFVAQQACLLYMRLGQDLQKPVHGEGYACKHADVHVQTYLYVTPRFPKIPVTTFAVASAPRMLED